MKRHHPPQLGGCAGNVFGPRNFESRNRLHRAARVGITRLFPPITWRGKGTYSLGWARLLTSQAAVRAAPGRLKRAAVLEFGHFAPQCCDLGNQVRELGPHRFLCGLGSSFGGLFHVLNEPGSDGSGDDAEHGNAAHHERRCDHPADRRHGVGVAVSDGGDGGDGPPEGGRSAAGFASKLLTGNMEGCTCFCVPS
jgi:hypothetical protein